MLAAYFVTCVMNAVAVQSCSVSHTEMSSLTQDLTTCTKAAATLQDQATQAILISDLTLIVVRKVSGCASPAQAQQRAMDEFNKLRAQGVDVELFTF